MIRRFVNSSSFDVLLVLQGEEDVKDLFFGLGDQRPAWHGVCLAASIPPIKGASMNGRGARYIEPDMVYHVLNRITGGVHLLRSDHDTTSMITGVLARARERHPTVKLFAPSVLSNHFLC